MTKKFFSALLVLLIVLQCFVMAVPTAFAATTDLESAGIVTADDSSVVYYEDDIESVPTTRDKTDLASVGVKDAGTTLEITKQPISVSAKKGAEVKVTFSAKGDGLTYKWYYKNAGASKFTRTTTFTSNIYATTMTDTRNGRQIYCVVTDKYGNSVKTNTVTLMMKTSLVITKQPVPVQAQLGATAKVSVSAQGEGLTYKWYYKNAGASKFALTTSFTSNVYSVKMTDARNGRQVYCEISDKYGNVVKSNVVSLTMGAVLEITKQPQSVVAVKGAVAKVAFSAKGEGLVYNWYYKNAGASKFSRTTTFTSNTYTTTMSSSRSGRQIYCVVTDKFGNSVKTNTVTLTMGTALEITKQPASVTLPAGKVVNITFTAKGDGLTYNWYYKNAGSSKFVYTSTFKSNTYSVEMNKARDGRMLYCEVTDKYGNTVRTNTVVLDMGTSLKITKQPTSIVAHKDYKAKVSFSVQGDGLSYKWYYKNAGASEFAITNTYKSNYYSVIMNSHRSGREVYCVITDKYGDSVKTNTVTITMDHIYGEWEVYRAATAEREGVERRRCTECSYYKDRTIPKLTAVYYITTDLGVGTPSKVGVVASGEYKLENPKREGYSFAGWKDANGNDFPREGVIKENVTITALWNLDGTDTLKELIDRTNAGIEAIKITSDIVISKPIYISYNTKIYSDGDFTLLRDPNFKGDMFVVGSDNKGQSSVVLGRDAVLTLGGGEGTLTIDGNRDNLKVTVVGSAVFVADSATLNLYDGIRIANNMKLGNERIYNYSEIISTSTGENAGGAAILNFHATVNMYGGVIENNLVATQHTIITNEDGTQTSKESFACGGGVYNRGHFNMTGGKICNNEALRGGGFYTDRVAYMVSGEISNNIAHYYGAAISTSSGQYADLFIGSEGEGETMLIDGNHSYRAGGALYSNTSSPIIIYGNTVISNNVSDTSGGAIYSAGPITAKNTVFDSNSCYNSGGAIYNHYTKAEFNRRLMELSNCTFKNNSGNLGGAVILSAQDSVAETGLGTYATIKDCNFIGNNAIANNGSGGNGGALYITRKSETIISRCLFEENTAHTNAGALAAHSEANVDLVDCEFIRNTGNLGGAMYTSSGAKAELKNILFDSNKTVLKENGSGGNGGALYVSLAVPTFDNVDFINNSAANHAGAVYMHATTLKFDSTCEFDSNSAVAHGGAFYLTYRNLEDGTKDGSVLKATDVEFKNNSAMAGGAISIRTGCDAQLKNVKLTGNSATGVEKDAQGGGAVYVGFGSLTLNKVTATDNSCLGYGGVINSVSSAVDVQSGSYQNNVAMSGGVFNGISNSTLTVEDTDFIDNESNYVNTDYNNSIGGGAINLYSGKLSISNSTLDGNKSGYYGGAVVAAKADVTINNNTVVKNSEGSTGAALFFRMGSNVKLDNISLIDNVSKYNGVLYANGGTLEAINVTASGNTAPSGGVLYASGATTQVTLKDLTWSGNTGTNGGAGYVSEATVTATNCKFTDNTANLGGVFYAKKGNLNMENVEFTSNSAVRNSGGGAGNGGVITMTGGTVTTDSATTFAQNSAENHAGAIYVSYTTDTMEDGSSVNTPSTLIATGTEFDSNTAMAGGAISIRTGGSAELNEVSLTNNSVEGFNDTTNNGDGEGGGAVYVGYGSLTLNYVTATNNTASDFGGAIDAVKSTVVVNGGTFSENKTNTGGMINSVSGSDITISNAEIKNNESVYENTEYNSAIGGGAICTSGGSLTVSDTVLDGNKSAYYGGTVMTSSTDVKFSGNTVVKNSEGGTGAALNFKNKSTVSLEDISITDNTSEANGIVYVNNCTVTFSNVTATGNKAAQGGVIYASNANTKITVTDSAFTQNNATKGGVVYITNGAIEFNGTNLANNTGKNGAVIYSDNANVTFTSSTVNGNMATSSAGAVYATSGSVNFVGGTVSENTAPTGGVFFTEKAGISLDGTVVNKNSATGTGGVAYTEDGTFEFKNAIVSENSAQGNAGVLYVKYTEVTFDASEFSDNASNSNGGVLYLSGAKGTIKNDCTFIGNSAVNHGGAIYDVYTNAVNTEEEQRDRAVGELTVTGGTFEENTAMAGAVVSIRTGCDAVFNGSTFKNNSVSGFAGNNDGDGEGGSAVYVGYGSMTLNVVTATGNTASDFGGVVEAMAATAVNINGGKYTDNSTISGAVVRAISKSNVAVNGATIENNTADDYGVIYQNTGTISMTNVTASENTAGFGGVLYASNASAKVTVADSTFTNNTANLGGALNINSGTATITDSTFKENNAVKVDGSYGNGGAIIVTAGTLSATGNNVFDSNTAENHGGAVYVSYSTVNNEKVGGSVNMTDGLFKNNTAAVSGGAISSRTNCSVTFTGTEFTANKAISKKTGEGGGAIYTNTNNLTLSGVVMDGNTSGYYAGALMASDATVTINENSIIKNSQGGTGAALHFASTSDVTISDTEFVNNTASVNGVIYVNNSVVDMTGISATGNKAASGGVIYASNANTRITATDSTLTNNNATNGGVAYIANGAINFVGGVISENTAKTGAVVYSDNGKVSFDGTSITKNTASSTAGVAYTVDGTLNFTDASVEENTASGNGGAVYVKYTPVTITDSTFSKNISQSNGGALYLGGSKTIINNSDFSENYAKNHGGAIYDVYLNAVDTQEEQRDKAVSNITVTGGTFEGNTAMAGAVVSIRTDCDAKFNGSTFKNNSVSGYDAKADGTGVNDGNGEGGGAVYVGYGSLTLNDVTATGNTASDFGGVVDSVSSTVFVNGGTYTENKSNSGAVLYAMSKSTVNIDGANISSNESVYENKEYNNLIGGTVYANGGTLNISATTLDGNKTGYYGGAVYARDGATVNINENSVISNSTGATGAAMYFRESCVVTMEDITVSDNTSTGNGVIYQIGGTMTMTNVTATGNQGSNGGVLFSSGTSTKTIINDCNFIDNTASSGGAITVSEANVTVTGGEFKNNSATLGGAVNIGTGSLTISGVTFTNNSAVKNASGSDGNGGAIIVVAGTLTATGDNVFDGNTAENHGGAVYVSYKTKEDGTKVGGVVNMTDGLFMNNTALAGGAISSRTNGNVALTGTEFKNNTATSVKSGEGGGAIFTNNNKLTLSGVVADGNSTGFYGGAITALAADVIIKDNSQFKNNVGCTGLALHLRNGGTCTLNEVEVKDNVSGDGNGAIYITGNGTLDITSLTASGNENINGGVIYASGSAKVTVDKSTLTGNTATSLGGAIDYRASGTLTITNTTLNGNKAANGGSLHIGGSGAVTIKNSIIDGNTATKLGGGIYHEGSGLLTVTDNTTIKSNSAPSGGGLYLDLGAKANVSSTEFDANFATSADGGAILVADSSEDGKSATSLTMTDSVLKNNTAKGKGGAISTDTSSPNLVINASDCEFIKNSTTTAGGGAIEIQNGNQPNATDPTSVKITFTDCTFTENSAKTTGGAIEIRTSSCAKIDGIAATKNSSKQNGGVVYLTSNHSRLYLTGDVTLSGNSASSGTFAYLYNNKYTNPPKIYTTDSNTAAWYKDVKGNTSSVVFDLTTMP